MSNPTFSHTSFDPETNQRLDDYYQAWDLADRTADRYDYENTEYNTEADNAARLYDTLLAGAKKHRQPHQITAGVYNSTIRFDTPENALKFATVVNGELDGRTVTTQAALVDVDRALIRNDIFGGMIRARSFSPVNMPAFLRTRAQV
jgi:uncharacterized protein (DUF2336 family)